MMAAHSPKAKDAASGGIQIKVTDPSFAPLGGGLAVPDYPDSKYWSDQENDPGIAVSSINMRITGQQGYPWPAQYQYTYESQCSGDYESRDGLDGSSPEPVSQASNLGSPRKLNSPVRKHYRQPRHTSFDSPETASTKCYADNRSVNERHHMSTLSTEQTLPESPMRHLQPEESSYGLKYLQPRATDKFLRSELRSEKSADMSTPTPSRSFTARPLDRMSTPWEKALGESPRRFDQNQGSPLRRKGFESPRVRWGEPAARVEDSCTGTLTSRTPRDRALQQGPLQTCSRQSSPVLSQKAESAESAEWYASDGADEAFPTPRTRRCIDLAPPSFLVSTKQSTADGSSSEGEDIPPPCELQATSALKDLRLTPGTSAQTGEANEAVEFQQNIGHLDTQTSDGWADIRGTPRLVQTTTDDGTSIAASAQQVLCRPLPPSIQSPGIENTGVTSEQNGKKVLKKRPGLWSACLPGLATVSEDKPSKANHERRCSVDSCVTASHSSGASIPRRSQPSVTSRFFKLFAGRTKIELQGVAPAPSTTPPPMVPQLSRLRSSGVVPDLDIRGSYTDRPARSSGSMSVPEQESQRPATARATPLAKPFDPEWQNNPAFDELSSFDDAMLSDKSLEALKSDLEKGYLVVRLQLLGQRLKEHPNHANVANWIAEFERTKNSKTEMRRIEEAMPGPHTRGHSPSRRMHTASTHC